MLEAARKLYNGYVEEGLRMTPPMKGFGVQYIRFAMEEHNLFSLLFMQKREAELLYHNMFTYAHGIATMSATGACSFSLEEIAQMLGMTCRSMLIGMKMPKDEREKTMPQLGGSMQGSVESYMMVVVCENKKN